jgi:hypothetical protein
MNDRELDDLGRRAMRRTEAEPDLMARLRPRPRPSLLGEALACLFSGSATLVGLWFFFVPTPAADSISRTVAPAEVPAVASTEHQDMARWLARGE